jgi:TrmH family RNA methyltransferase
MLSKNEIKYIQSLRQKKSRIEAQLFIAEGPKIVQEIISEKPGDIQGLYATDAWINDHPGIDKHIPLKKIESFELEKISLLQTPQQVLAVMKMPPDHFIPFKENTWHLMLDGIQDPGNMGSILRIADWFGISQLYATNQTVDCHNPKVVQAAMGSVWRVNICYGPCHDWLKQTNLPVYGATLDGEDIFKLGKTLPKGIMVIGSEGKGIGEELARHLTRQITIPRIGKAESLNAAVATGIIMSQLLHK